MELDEKFEKCLLAYKTLIKSNDYMTYSQYTSFDITQQEYDFNQELYKILEKNSDKIYKDVVVFNKKGNDICEIDYVLLVKGNFVLIKTCNLEGNLKVKSKNKMLFTYTQNGEIIYLTRKDPILELDNFKSNFIRYLKRLKIKYRKDAIKEVILFTNNNLVIEDKEKYSSKNHYFKLDTLLDYFASLDKVSKVNYSNLRMPSFDKGYQMDKGFFNIVLTDDYFNIDNKEYPISEFKYIVFNSNKNENDLLIKPDASCIRLYLNKSKINCNSKTKLKNLNIDFLVINTQLHYFKSPIYQIEKIDQTLKSNENKFKLNIAVLVVSLIVACIFLTLYFVNKEILPLVFGCIGGGFLVYSIVEFVILFFKNKSLNKKKKKCLKVLENVNTLPTINEKLVLENGEIFIKSEIKDEEEKEVEPKQNLFKKLFGKK